MKFDQLKNYVIPAAVELLKSAPGIGTFVSVADKINDTNEGIKQELRISKLEEHGELLEVAGITFYLSEDILEESVQRLTKELNTEYKECINYKSMETGIDDVIVSKNKIDINFTSSVEKEYLVEEVEVLIEELMSFFEEAYIQVNRLGYY